MKWTKQQGQQEPTLVPSPGERKGGCCWISPRPVPGALDTLPAQPPSEAGALILLSYSGELRPMGSHSERDGAGL